MILISSSGYHTYAAFFSNVTVSNSVYEVLSAETIPPLHCHRYLHCYSVQLG